MGYYNPILAYGVERFAEQAAAAGADGFIVPDLPPEIAAQLQGTARRTGWRWCSCWHRPPRRSGCWK
jgi:tryptophan synthase alpha chain